MNSFQRASPGLIRFSGFSFFAALGESSFVHFGGPPQTLSTVIRDDRFPRNAFRMLASPHPMRRRSASSRQRYPSTSSPNSNGVNAKNCSCVSPRGPNAYRRARSHSKAAPESLPPRRFLRFPRLPWGPPRQPREPRKRRVSLTVGFALEQSRDS